MERPSWQAQISGKKSWKLIPPAECESVCTSLNVTMNSGDIGKFFHFIYYELRTVDSTSMKNTGFYWKTF